MARKTLTSEVVESLADADRLAADAELARLRSEVASLKGRYKAALSQIDKERERADSMLSLQGVKPVRPKVASKKQAKKHAATMVLMLSDCIAKSESRPRRSTARTTIRSKSASGD
jgi:hypothetical protein